jgi:hypothetical protein
VLAQLGVQEVDFDLLDGNTLGYANRGSIAGSPLSPLPHKTTFHDWPTASSTWTRSSARRRAVPQPQGSGGQAVALLCSGALGLAESEYARGYIQHWLAGEGIPEANARRIFGAADRILRADRPDAAGTLP